MQLSSPLNYERDDVVKIHGNWCGPNWTGGQKVSADEYTGPWDGPAISKLDEACRSHDKSCSTGSCTRAADTRLIRAAEKRILPQSVAAMMQIQLLNPLMSKSKRKKLESRLQESQDAVIVATGIEIARIFRRS